MITNMVQGSVNKKSCDTSLIDDEFIFVAISEGQKRTSNESSFNLKKDFSAENMKDDDFQPIPPTESLISVRDDGDCEVENLSTNPQKRHSKDLYKTMETGE